MNPEQHPDYQEEKQHLEYTLQEMQQLVAELEGDMESRTRRVQLSQGVRDEISAYIHAMLKNDDAIKICDIKAIQDSPYFGRVDFREDEEPEFESFYIGRAKVARSHIGSAKDILVFDWRDPVATVFYECHGGRANYDVLERYHYSGDVRLKRRYKIEDGQLEMLVDDYVAGQLTAGQTMLADPILQQRLLQGAGEKLKDIITSIQEEQNQIIRESPNQVVVIQGVAGSGKSTVGLHRLSYLLYNEKMDPKKMVIIAPNRLFLDYICELLPEIDAKDVGQTVWDELAFAISGQQWQLLPDRRLELFLSTDRRLAAERSAMISAARIKGSLEFQQVLDAYMGKRVKKFCMALEDMELFDGRLNISRKQQIDMFLSDSKLPYNERIRVLLQFIRFQIRNFIDVLEARNRSVTKDALFEEYRKTGEQWLNRYAKKWKLVDLKDAYAAVFKDKSLFKVFKQKTYDWQAVLEHSLRILEQGNVERDDLAPLCYLKYVLDGWDVQKFSHIVVDEAQDMNAFEFAILRMLSVNGAFTIMGDMSQGIHSYRSVDSWQALLKEVFAGDRSIYREIRHSYRSSREIIELFNAVMPKGFSPAVPVYATGQQPVFASVESNEEGAAKVAALLANFEEKGYKTVGIITKSDSSSKLVWQLLQSSHSVPELHLLTSENASYRGGISVVSVAMSKGLEFDAVIIWNASSQEFGAGTLDAKLLYVAISRAMHGLYILYQQTLTPLLAARELETK